jgi:hypothetical protein
MKKFLKVLYIFLLLSAVFFFSYFNNTRLVNPVTVAYYTDLKKSLKENGYKDRLLVVSTKRFKWDNYLLVKFGNAVPNSRHMKGEALDFLVFDINSDGKTDGIDVDIVSGILKNKIIKENGNVGVYKNKGLLYKQLVHIDGYNRSRK